MAAALHTPPTASGPVRTALAIAFLMMLGAYAAMGFFLYDLSTATKADLMDEDIKKGLVIIGLVLAMLCYCATAWVVRLVERVIGPPPTPHQTPVRAHRSA